ncbi:DUF6640 family protein [Tengunoibacter tsumagoiensis]|uniref:Acetyltransferase n=1 Tax=Tengunoibacter tsumagoiensis TaxID=2014871 RepID=A0A402A715_9CHLR|nr:DUF6640 family protein [Tengunoibacter tsumagoiensis]GCE14825.1 hypothetical protein KTT_46840 [Tengunoibacter tsumagoiensis]
MDSWMNLARVLVSLAALFTLVGAVLADLVIPATAKQHIYNPNWPPHAKFHNGQTIFLGVFLGLMALWLLWYPGSNLQMQFHLAVVVAALYWLSMLGAMLLPGTKWSDPEFHQKPLFGMPPQLFIGCVLLACLILSEILYHL